MSKKNKGRNTIEECFMYACFWLAVVAASAAAIALYVDGVASLQSWSIAGVGLAASGVWASLGIFLYQDRKRKENDELIKSELKKIRKAQKKCECKCQADCCGEADAPERQRRSWLLGLFFGGARR